MSGNMEDLTLRKVRCKEDSDPDKEKAVPPEWKAIIHEAFIKSEHRALLECAAVKENLGKSYPTHQNVICDKYDCYYVDKRFEMGLDYFNFEKMHVPNKNDKFTVLFGRELIKTHLPVYNVIVDKFIELMDKLDV